MLAAGAEVGLEGVTWRVALHPTAPHAAWSRAGSSATVYRLDAGPSSCALKLFHAPPANDIQRLRAQALSALVSIDGLRAAERRVVTERMVPALPAVVGGLWMPWIDGYTWSDVVRVRTPLTADQSLHLARALAAVLARLEARALVHGNLSGESVMITSDTIPRIELVDLEHLTGPGLTSPHPPSRTAPGGVRSAGRDPEAQTDRFGGAVVLGEMLGWCMSGVRDSAAGASFFESEAFRLGARSERAAHLFSAVRACWGAPVAALLEEAWTAPCAADAPQLSVWVQALATVTVPPRMPEVRPFAPAGGALMAGVALRSDGARGHGSSAVSAAVPPASWSRVASAVALSLLLLAGGGVLLLRGRTTASPAVAASASPSPAASASPAVAASASPSSVNAPSLLTDVVMCRRVDAHGAPVDPVRTYDPFATFCCSARVPAGHQGVEIGAEWRTPGGTSRVSTATVEGDAESYVCVSLAPEQGAWIMGPYALVLRVAGTADKEVRFDVSATGR